MRLLRVLAVAVAVFIGGVWWMFDGDLAGALRPLLP